MGGARDHLAGIPASAWILDRIGYMCRSIVKLRTSGPVPDGAVEAAALQYVRKVSGFRSPSRANTEAFDRAVAEIAAATETLLASIVVRGQGHAGDTR